MNDDWGNDPSVRFMRLVFKSMEETEKRLLTDSGTSLFDTRLRRWRKTARDLFEHAWLSATRRGMAASEKEAGVLYAHCLARALSSDGIKIPDEALPRDEKIFKLVEEVKP